MLLNSVSKLGLFRAFDDPVSLGVDIKAVVGPLKKKRQFSSKKHFTFLSVASSVGVVIFVV